MYVQIRLNIFTCTCTTVIINSWKSGHGGGDRDVQNMFICQQNMHIKEKEKRKKKKERRLGSSEKEDSILKSAVGRWWAIVFV